MIVTVRKRAFSQIVVLPISELACLGAIPSGYAFGCQIAAPNLPKQPQSAKSLSLRASPAYALLAR